jgi:Uma2 family endonuclease
MIETTERLTDEELMNLPDDGLKHEYVDGEVTSMAVTGLHEDIGAILMYLLTPYALKVGRIYGSSVGCRMRDGNIRVPDVSVMRTERLPDGRSPNAFLEGAPDLCVEIISPSENRTDMFRKISEYFDSGASQVWHIFPDTRKVVVYSLTEDVRVYETDNELTGGDVVPGFRCRVAELFEAVQGATEVDR